MLNLQVLRDRQLEARKDPERKVEKNLLTTLLGEVIAVGKDKGNRDPNVDEIIAIINKFIKNMDDTLSHRPDDKLSLQERTILMSLLPSQFSEGELIIKIQNIIDDNCLTSSRDIGVVMKELKTKYNGQFNSGRASQIAKGMLN